MHTHTFIQPAYKYFQWDDPQTIPEKIKFRNVNYHAVSVKTAIDRLNLDLKS